MGFPGDSAGKESAWNAGDLGLIPGLGRYSGEGNGNSLQYSCMENPMDRGDWRAIVHGSQRGHNLATEQQQLQRSALGQFQFFIFCSINMI